MKILRHLKQKSALVASSILIGATLAAPAYSFPDKTVTIVVPYAPGGATDASARLIAQALQKKAGVGFVVENVPGAGTTIGAARVARSTPDGYTLLWGGLSSNVIAPRLYEKLPFNPKTSFEPITTIAAQPFLIVTKANSKFKTLEELLSAAKANPDKINFGSPGQGSSPHLNSELLLTAVRAGGVHVPFRGASPALTALVAGDIDFMSDTPTAPMPLIKAGQLRALAVTSKGRLAELPDVPTVSESALRGFESSTWFALFAPKGTPQAAVMKLNELVKSVLDDSEVRAQMNRAFFSIQYSSPAELAKRIDLEGATWDALIRDKKLRLE